jgi:hypothetical protein
VSTFQARPREETIRAWREYYADRKVETPKPRNAQPVIYLTDPLRIPALGRMWTILPVSVPDAIRVQGIMDRMEELRGWETEPGRRAEARTEYAAILAATVDLIPRLVEPTGRGRRTWWLRKRLRNPFRRATEAELVDMLLGFSMRRKMGRDRRDVERPSSMTTSTDAPRSPTGFPRGADRTDSPSRGATTSTGSRTSSGRVPGRN